MKVEANCFTSITDQMEFSLKYVELSDFLL